jgi:hypothetical protein
MPKRIQLPDDFYKHDFKQLAKVENVTITVEEETVMVTQTLEKVATPKKSPAKRATRGKTVSKAESPVKSLFL